ncbi:MAG: ABC transporter ATP-binding protein/permease [Anaerolineae bacterium]|nr:ABC transporter ATP-binding protein/permease [Anaerolineae bacterium]
MNTNVEHHFSQQLGFDLKGARAKNRLLGLWRMMTGFRLVYLGALISITIGAAARTGTYLLLRHIIDTVFTQGQNLDKLPLFALSFVALAGVEGLFSYLRGIWSARTAEGITVRLRNYLFDHTQRLTFTYHDHTKTGGLIQRATSDVDTLRRFYADQAVGIGRIVALFTINFVMLLQMNTRLGWLSVIIMPLVLVMSYFFFGKVSKAYERYQEQEAKLSTILQENISGVRVVKAFARQRYEMDKFEWENKEKYRRGKRLLVMHSLYWPISDILCSGQTLLVMIVGASMTIRGEITLGTYVAVIGMVVWIIWPLRNLGRLIVQVSTGLVSYRRVMEIISETREDMESGETWLAEKELRGEFIFRNVELAYQPAPPEQDEEEDKEDDAETPKPLTVLHDISFHVKPGQTVALLGSTGSGKTSIVNLLLRFYDYQTGSITLDGLELREYPKRVLRQRIGIVEQEPFLFSRSIRENIAYGPGREVTEEEVVAAAEAAAVHEVIQTFPKVYDTLVGEKGVTLSGGQRQRVALARTLLKNPSILILDAATSSVDTETEMQIEAALDRQLANRTTFIIAHRIQTVMRADWILVLDKGRIVQQGVHEDLVQESGLYRETYEIQAQIEEEVEREVTLE